MAANCLQEERKGEERERERERIRRVSYGRVLSFGRGGCHASRGRSSSPRCVPIFFLAQENLPVNRSRWGVLTLGVRLLDDAASVVADAEAASAVVIVHQGGAFSWVMIANHPINNNGPHTHTPTRRTRTDEHHLRSSAPPLLRYDEHLRSLTSLPPPPLPPPHNRSRTTSHEALFLPFICGTGKRPAAKRPPCPRQLRPRPSPLTFKSCCHS